MTVKGPFAAGCNAGFIGLGSMGSGMAANLLRKGYRVHVYARRADAAHALVQAGAVSERSPAGVAHECDLVFLSLPDAAAVEQVLFGDGGLVEALAPGSVVVDTSTISATAARDLGAQLNTLGIWMLDAPVSGGQQGAEAGTLACMVGGPAAVLEACREALGTFCKGITHVGELGAGQTVKACNQVAVAAAMLGVADAIALARAHGVDPMVMREVLLGGTARSVPLERHAPRIVQEEFKPGFRATLMRKDLRIAIESARTAGVQLAAAPVAEQLLDRMCEAGRGDWDWCGVAKEVK